MLYAWTASFGASFGAAIVARSWTRPLIRQVGLTTILVTVVTVPIWLRSGAHQQALALPLASAVILPIVCAISDRWEEKRRASAPLRRRSASA